MRKGIILMDPELVAEMLAVAAIRDSEYPDTSDLLRKGAERIRELDRGRSAMMVALCAIRRGVDRLVEAIRRGVYDSRSTAGDLALNMMDTLQDVGEFLPISPTPAGSQTLRQMLTEYHGLLIKDIGEVEAETGYPALVAREVEGDIRRMLMAHHHAFGALDDSHLPELPPHPPVSG